MIVIYILAIALIIFIFIKPYIIKYDTVILYSGGLGSGKSYLSVKTAIKLLKKNRLKVWWHNNIKRYIIKVFRPHKPLRSRQEKPLLYSSIPVRISRKEWSVELTERHLCLVDRIVPRSITFVDELGSFASQFEYKNPNINDNVDEFVRFYRHYTLGGYFVANDQCSENIFLQVRRRANTTHNLMYFRIWFKLIYTCKCRNINISEEIKAVEENNTEDNFRWVIGLAFLRKKYDTYCYSERYKTTLTGNDKHYTKFKKNTLLKVSKQKIEKLTSDN